MVQIRRAALQGEKSHTMGFCARLFRHGESESNAGLVTKCAASPKLTALGHQQAIDIASQIAHPPSLFIVSSYVRTQQTAGPALVRYPEVPIEEWPVHEFTYLSSKLFDGTNHYERAAGVEAYWQRVDPEYCDGVGAESFSAFRARVQGFVRNLQSRGLQNVVVFTHGHFIRALMMELRERSIPLSDQESMREFAEYWRLQTIENGEEFLLTVR